MSRGRPAGLRPGNHAFAVKLAALPERARGFDVVKEAAMEQAAEARAMLFAAATRDAPAQTIAAARDAGFCP